MTGPADQSDDQAPPQSLLSEAVEQTTDTARKLLENLGHFAEDEADALASREYGLLNLATAPVRLFAILVVGAIDGASNVSDNLSLLSLNGQFGAPTARRATRVGVGITALPAGAKFAVSALVGQTTNYCIPAKQITVEDDTLATERAVTVVVHSALASPDIYAGTLFSTDPGRTVNKKFMVAIAELGVVVT